VYLCPAVDLHRVVYLHNAGCDVHLPKRVLVRRGAVRAFDEEPAKNVVTQDRYPSSLQGSMGAG